MLVWESMLDNRYDCQVLRSGEYAGILVVVDTTTGNKILSERVGLSYGAQFGPDADDVSLWEEMCVKAVDNNQ